MDERKNKYPELENLIGKKIRIILMKGEPLYNGRVGTVKKIDDLGQLSGTWGGLNLIPGLDEYEEI